MNREERANMRKEKAVEKLVTNLKEATEKSEVSTKKGVRAFYKLIRDFKKAVKRGFLPTGKGELRDLLTNAGVTDDDVIDPFSGGVRGFVEYLTAFL